jgi:Bacterial type II/III secretion system short domain
MIRSQWTFVWTVAFLVWTAGPVRSQEPGIERAATRPANNDVIRLQYAVADEVASVIGQALNPTFQRTRIVPDPRTNSIVVTGDEAGVQAVRSLAGTLDVKSNVTEKRPQRRSVTYEVVLFAFGPGADEALKLPRTSAGIIDSSDPDSVLAKLRENVGKAGVAEIAKLSIQSDDGTAWKSRQSGQVATVSAVPGGTSFGGYQEAALEINVVPSTAQGNARRLNVHCRIERFIESEKTGGLSGIPPAKQSNTLEFSPIAEDGKLLMTTVESSSARSDLSYVLFVRVKA